VKGVSSLNREALDVDTHTHTHTNTQGYPGGLPQSGICYRTDVLAICGDLAAKQITYIYIEVLVNKIQNLQVRMIKGKIGH
jgi:hypothetical protein